MCGIIAIAGEGAEKTNDRVLAAMLGTLSLRGPDDSGFDRFPGCVLGQTRLSIIDLAGGHQPMRDETLGLSIAFNGEIYNWKEIRTTLEVKGRTFHTHSDTEVILKAYSEYGTDCVHHLDGMFAFALWDETKKTLFIARDRFGKKPLFYGYDDRGRICIASEIKALRAGGVVEGGIDPLAIDNFLTLMYIPPWKTVYKNIHVLPPAYRGVWKDGALTTERYWSLPEAPLSVGYTEAKEVTRDLIQKAVKKRMLAADVEVGAFLSGGVDSTLVSAYAQTALDHPLKTFSIGYEDHINELPFALEASRAIGTEQHTLQASSDLVGEIESVLAYLDEPHADSSLFPQHILSKLAASQVKVALSGDGADELFMGYGWYSKWENVQKIVRLKNTLFSDRLSEHIKYVSVFTPAEREELWGGAHYMNSDIVSEAVTAARGNGIQKINRFDLTTYLPGQLLTKVDRTSMMHSLEVRCPFLDQALAEYVYNLPTEFKMNRRENKIILKDILLDIMPREFVYRRKQGFGAPVLAWLQTPHVRALAENRLRGNSRITQFFKKEAVASLLDRFYAKGDTSLHYKIWTLLSLEIWLATRI